MKAKKNSSDKNLNSGPYTIDFHNGIFGSAREGRLKLSDYRNAFQLLVDNNEEIKDRLGKYNKKTLFVMFRLPSHYFGTTKKPEVVKMAFKRIRNHYLLNRPSPNFTLPSFSGESVENAEKKYLKLLLEIFESTTEEDLKNYHEYTLKKNEALIQAKKAAHKALENPETWDEFQIFIDKKTVSALTESQLAKYDALCSDRGVKARKANTAKNSDISTDISLSTYTLVKTKHSKKGEDRFVLQLSGDRMGKSEFKELACIARQLDGNYVNVRCARMWGTIPGFQFLSENDRSNFIDLLNGNTVSIADKLASRNSKKQEKRIDHLQVLANDQQVRNEERLNATRNINTPRQAAIASGIETDSNEKINFSKLMRKIALKIAEGKLSYLSMLQHGTQLSELKRTLYSIEYRAPQEFTHTTGDGKLVFNTDITFDEKLKYVHLPKLEVSIRDLKKLSEEWLAVKGYILSARKIQKNIAVYGQDNERYVNIASHQWDGVRDKINRYSVDSKQPSVTCNIKNQMLRVQRLKQLNIYCESDLRNALRELNAIEVLVDKTEMDPLLQKERALIGSDIPGFVPSTKPLAEEITVDADIEPWHRVLEPNGGKGDVADEIMLQYPATNLKVIEINQSLRDILSSKGYELVGRDFLEHQEKYDRIVMNNINF